MRLPDRNAVRPAFRFDPEPEFESGGADFIGEAGHIAEERFSLFFAPVPDCSPAGISAEPAGIDDENFAADFLGCLKLPEKLFPGKTGETIEPGVVNHLRLMEIGGETFPDHIPMQRRTQPKQVSPGDFLNQNFRKFQFCPGLQRQEKIRFGQTRFHHRGGRFVAQNIRMHLNCPIAVRQDVKSNRGPVFRILENTKRCTADSGTGGASMQQEIAAAEFLTLELIFRAPAVHLPEHFIISGREHPAGQCATNYHRMFRAVAQTAAAGDHAVFRFKAPAAFPFELFRGIRSGKQNSAPSFRRISY